MYPIDMFVDVCACAGECSCTCKYDGRHADMVAGMFYTNGFQFRNGPFGTAPKSADTNNIIEHYDRILTTSFRRSDPLHFRYAAFLGAVQKGLV